jgi:dienelactone hydrolase
VQCLLLGDSKFAASGGRAGARSTTVATPGRSGASSTLRPVMAASSERSRRARRKPALASGVGSGAATETRPAVSRRRFQRALRAGLGAILVGALLLIALHLLFNGDKTAVIERVRGEFATARTLEEWRQGQSLCRLVELRNHSGEAVANAYVRTPVAAATSPRVLVTYAGQKTGRTILELIPERRDLVLVAVQYPYQRPRSAGAYLRWPHDVRRAVYRTVAGGMLALSFLERDGVDVRRTTVLGASLGTSFAVMHGALDPRVAAVLVVHGGGELPRIVWTSERATGHAWRAPFSAGLAALLLDPFDPVRWAGRIAPRPLTILASRRDRHFPPESAQALHDAAREPRTLLWTETEHVGAKKRELVAEIVAMVEAHLAAAPAPPRAQAPASR